MNSETSLSVELVERAFREEMLELGAKGCDICVDEGRVYARSALERSLEVGPRDGVRGGVAMRFCEGVLTVRPYVLRKVCTNGAVMAKALAAWEVLQTDVRDPNEVVVELREAIRACGSAEVFEQSAELMRSARMLPMTPDDVMLMVLGLGGRSDAARQMFVQLRRQVWGQLTMSGDHSRFGFMNAVTAVARETRDPERRWRLEELGGVIAARVGERVRPRWEAGMGAELAGVR